MTAIAAVSLLVPAGAAAGPGLARDSESFVNSIGVNVHLGYSTSAYNRFRRVRAALDRLGVHFIRDGISQGRPDLERRFRVLAGDGIRLDAIAGDPLRRWGSGSLRQQLTLAERLGPGVIASLEGPNEFDNEGIHEWSAILRRYQRRLWHGVHSRPAIASVPVLGPSLVGGDSRAQLGSIAPWTSEGNMHPYPGGNPPDSNDHMESELQLAFENTGRKRVQATETGYTNAIHATTGQGPASERAAGIYMPRLFLDNFRRGITRSYVYELIDAAPDPSRTETEFEFGLLRHDFSPKPAYTATRNLISILVDPGPPFAPGTLSYTLRGAPPGTRKLLLEKRNGSFYLAIWTPSSVWNPERRTGCGAASTTMTLSFGQAVSSASLFMPNRSADPIAADNSPAAIQVPVGPRVTIVKVTPAAA